MTRRSASRTWLSRPSRIVSAVVAIRDQLGSIGMRSVVAVPSRVRTIYECMSSCSRDAFAVMMRYSLAVCEPAIATHEIALGSDSWRISPRWSDNLAPHAGSRFGSVASLQATAAKATASNSTDIRFRTLLLQGCLCRLHSGAAFILHRADAGRQMDRGFVTAAHPY